jgi:hypothetical protein
MTLSEQQRAFTRCIGQLIGWAYANGYELTFGDAYRSPQQAAANAASGTGIKNSNHTRRLAVDLNLFIDGVYRTGTEDHRPLGEYFVTLHPDARWGGHFKKPDGNHYSFEWEGVK